MNKDKTKAELTESELCKASQIFAQAINDLNESGLMEESRLNYQVNKFLESINAQFQSKPNDIEEKTREGAIKVAMKNYTPSKALGDMQPIVEAIDALIDAGYISLPKKDKQ